MVSMMNETSDDCSNEYIFFFGNSKDVILTNEEMANDLFNRRMEKEENK